jgi:uncharacterized membrane protein
MLEKSGGAALFDLVLWIAIAIGAVTVIVGLSILAAPAIVGGVVLLAPSMFLIAARALDGPGG